MSNSLDVFDAFSRAYAREKFESMSLRDYLLAARDNPMMYATPAERMIAAIGEPEFVDTSRDPRLSRAMLEQLPRIGAFDAVEQLNRRFAELLASWLDLHPGEAEVDDNALAAQVVVTALDALCSQAVTYRPELFESPRFTEHVERLVLGYLAPTRAATRFGVVKPARAHEAKAKGAKAPKVTRDVGQRTKAAAKKGSAKKASAKKAAPNRTRG